MKIFSIISLAAPLIGVVLTTGCAPAEVETPERARPVKVHRVSSGLPLQEHTYPGRTAAHQEASLAFEVAGQVVDLRIKEGDQVQAGDVLAQLDDRDYQSALNAAKVRFEEAVTERKRRENLLNRSAGTPVDLDRAQVLEAAARAEYEIALKRLEDTRLRAPFSGYIARLMVDDFANILPKQTIAVLQDTSLLEVVVDIPETIWILGNPDATVAELTEQARPRVTLTSLPGREMPVTMTEYAATADPITRTFAMTGNFVPPADLNISPGMTASVRFLLPRRAGANAGSLVPVNAVAHTSEGDAIVWLVDESTGRVSRQPVEVGEMIKDRIEVLRGLSADDLIVASGLVHLEEGMLVTDWK